MRHTVMDLTKHRRHEHMSSNGQHSKTLTSRAVRPSNTRGALPPLRRPGGDAGVTANPAGEQASVRCVRRGRWRTACCSVREVPARVRN